MREKSKDREMNTRVRTALQTMKAASKHNKGTEREKKVEMQKKAPLNRIQSRRERKIALQQDVDKLKKKLRHEENVHRALERAFTRPLGALPRLPPYLPSHTLELLAEVAVLEEEVVRLEEQVVNFRQGLYQEAVYISSSKKPSKNTSDMHSDIHRSQNSKAFGNSNVAIATNPSPSTRWASNGDTSLKKSSKKVNLDDCRGKENQVNSNSSKKSKQSSAKKVSCTRITDDQRISDEAAAEEGSVNGPNKLSEDILNCLMRIYSQMSSTNDTEPESLPSISGSSDPYDICSEFGRRDIGPYKHFVLVEPSSADLNLTTSYSLVARKLKILQRKLTLVDLSGLTHQQKLAFWINIYNSCMMNAFLEQSIPTTPQMIVALMPKAMVNVGGNSISAMTIEHFILRLPYRSKNTCPKGLKSDEITTRGDFGLDWAEPLVTFALSCGSWSSPAVRIYTACQVDKQLETAKREYLQAAIGISIPNKLAIPKLLDWYLLDFAQDVESLMDWICLQLPRELRNDAVKCIETGRRSEVRQAVQVLPYEFRFRYILAT